MRTLPPSGLAPTLPPAPRERARRAVRFSLLSLVLLLLALVSQRFAHGDASLLFAYNNDSLAAEVLARLLFGTSLIAQLAAMLDTRHVWRRQLGAAVLAWLVAAAWLLSVAWLIARNFSP